MEVVLLGPVLYSSSTTDTVTTDTVTTLGPTTDTVTTGIQLHNNHGWYNRHNNHSGTTTQ